VLSVRFERMFYVHFRKVSVFRLLWKLLSCSRLEFHFKIFVFVNTTKK